MKRTRVTKARVGKVGYGRPPQTHQFKPGQSGNPMGRQKGAKNETTILRNLLNRKIEMRQDGKLRKISLLEAMLLRFAEDALKGNPKAAAFLLNRYAPMEWTDADPSHIDRDDEQILESFTRRLEAEFRSTKEKQ
jgi:hypothetical protein